MKTLRLFYVLSIAILLTGITFSTAVSADQNYKVNSGSKLWFDGTSTIHDFTCKATKLKGNVSIEGDLFSADKSGKLNKVSLVIPVKKITNKDEDLTENMHEAFNVDDFSNITFNLIKADLLNVKGDVAKVKAKGNLKISGVTKVVYITLTIKKKGNALAVTGSTSLKMSTYGIEPPSMFFGTVNTADEVKISFDLTLKQG
ncbi:MAG: YceI family protein [Candidatus Kapabacteria bacterium]|nr:YceI family protein [Candidatus Kapabacteria bacterium]